MLKFKEEQNLINGKEIPDSRAGADIIHTSRAWLRPFRAVHRRRGMQVMLEDHTRCRAVRPVRGKLHVPGPARGPAEQRDSRCNTLRVQQGEVIAVCRFGHEQENRGTDEPVHKIRIDSGRNMRAARIIFNEEKLHMNTGKILNRLLLRNLYCTLRLCQLPRTI